MNKQRHIYFFLPNFSIGGAGNSILNICKSIINKENTIKVISIGKNSYKNRLKDLGIETVEIKSKRSIIAIFKIYYYLKKTSENKKVIFVSNINYANVLSCLILKRIKNLKLILVERTPLQELEIYKNFLDYFKKKVILIMARFFYVKADYVIGNSYSVSSYISKKINIKVKTIYPLIKIYKSKRKKKKKILNITWIGRFSMEKNLDDFLKALNHIETENYKVNIVTNVNIIKYVKNICHKNIYKKLNIFYFKNDMKFLRKIYKLTDIYVSTSIYEGFPNTIVEAVCNECLIITSNSFGGCKEIIKNENYGLKYNTFNYMQLSKKINFAIKNFDKCKNKIKYAKGQLTEIAKKNNSKYNQFFSKF